MGEVVRYECEKCGYRFRLGLGVGGSFFIETVIKAKNGEFGEEAKRFFEEHSDEAIEAINYEGIIMRCEKCGEYESHEALTMYVPKEDHVMSYSIPSWDLWKKGCTKYADYPHKCEYCGGDMRIIASDEPVVCPHCGEEMAKSLVGFWD
ncbi:MAG: hypothetical protein II876_09670 [Synergistaceae bacterium]|nr:hypothetical protein [Synergistaceae bacterium]MBQ6664815.1 hypothetical protein [Synergistaceae bacterium]